MELSFSKINGTNRHLDYEAFKQSVETQLEPTCKKAELIILNRFPVSVSPQSNIDFVILLNLPKMDRSWYRVEHGGERMYVKNQIIAVSVVDEYIDSNIKITGDTIEVDNAIASFDEISPKLKWGLTNYLASHCAMERQYITVHPLIWIKNNNTVSKLENIYIGKDLEYQTIEDIIIKNYYFKWAGYKEWQNNDIIFEHQIQMIFEQASKDSAEGYITKKKIDRFQYKLGKKQGEAFNFIGEKLVEITGKAGTGKTAELLKWMLQNSLNGKKAVFLTYNHLLVYDIASQINSFSNRLADNVHKVSTTTYTIHGYFYNVSKKLGVLLLLTEERIRELTSILDIRINLIEEYFDSERLKENEISLAKLLSYVQNIWKVDEGLKREAILFLKYMENTFLPSKIQTAVIFKEFRDEKIQKLANLESSNVFIRDYHKVLERVLQATTNLDAFLKDLDVENKFELLSNVMNLKDDMLVTGGRGKIDFEKLKTRYQKGLSGFRAGRTVYIDEAQDCHPLERDIFFNLFGSKNCVIANGGKEQLIRYSQLCNWRISQNVVIEGYGYPKASKSFRMKPAIAALANFVADWYGIDLNIEPIETEDHGQVFIATTDVIENQINAIKHFTKVGERQGCTNYESLLLLKPANSNDSGGGELETDNSVRINEFDNIVKDSNQNRGQWDLIKEAQEKVSDAFFWNATGNVDKRKMAPPGSLSIRSIYYESCRGLEAWSVMCFGLDAFFDFKANEDEADNFLLNEIIFDADSPELKRRHMYAATWALMALTRCIENCYIQLIDPQSSLYECILAFSKEHTNYVTRVK